MKQPNKPGYWWYKDDEYDGIWLVTQDGRITDGAFVYNRDEFNGEWIPVQRPDEINVALKQAYAEGYTEAVSRCEHALKLVIAQFDNISDEAMKTMGMRVAVNQCKELLGESQVVTESVTSQEAINE